MSIAEKGVSDAKLSMYQKFAEYVENHHVDIYVDYRDELSREQIDNILEGKADDVRNDIEYDYIFYMDRDEYYWTEMAEKLEVELEDIHEWLNDDGFWPSAALTDYDWRRLLSNSNVCITATMWDVDFNFNCWAYGQPLEYKDVKEALRILGINPAEFKALSTGGSMTSGDGKFKGYFPNMPNRVPAVDIKEIYSGMCSLYDGVMNFCLGDLEEVAEVVSGDSKYITFKAGTNVVMYNYINGAGITEFPLTADVTVRRKDVEFGNDGTSQYGIQECYGFVSSYWKEGGVRNGE